MKKEKLYKLSLDSYHEYPLLAELMAIRDEKFKDEQQDRMLCVNGYISIDALNNYVKSQQENQQLKIQISAKEEEYKKLEETNKVLSRELTKGNLIKQDHLTTCCGIPIADIPKLKQENEELKKQLEVGKEQYNDLVEEKEKLEEQLSSITLELEEYKKQVNNGLYSTCLPYKTGYDKAVINYKTQQQEFIKYMEDKVKYFKDLEQFAIKTFINKAVINLDLVKISINEDRIVIENLEEILAKYKEIIGVSDEKD